MFELINFEKSFFVKFGSGKNTGFIVFVFDAENITILDGINTIDERIPQTTIQNGVKGKINPTKVFLFVVKVLKKTLCPECI